MIWRDYRSMGSEQYPLILSEKEGIILTAWQWRRWQTAGVRFPEDVVVTAPDFLRYARVLGTGRVAELASLAGVSRSAIAGSISGIKNLHSLPKLAKMDFWTVGKVLISYDIALLGMSYRQPVMLHSNLTDMALYYDRLDFLQTFARTAGFRGYGFHTTQLHKLLSALARTALQPQKVSYLTSPGTVEADESMVEFVVGRHSTLTATQWIAEADSWSPELLPIAMHSKVDVMLAYNGSSQHPPTFKPINS